MIWYEKETREWGTEIRLLDKTFVLYLPTEGRWGVDIQAPAAVLLLVVVVILTASGWIME
jgi:hypothetical protein